jgi:hypothetical protein
VRGPDLFRGLSVDPLLDDSLATCASTPFGLYRDGHELRGIYAAHRKRARAACRAVRDGLFKDGGCDYAALIGNSDLYGGLGGEFTITTASRLNGALVLRHEIGHSLIDVGEEYEGGYAYFGGPCKLPRSCEEYLSKLK